eukprot:TRINITY_DN2131_c0_g1_i2.p1 TRINITY_DN2131_c0_g1~~TRINITY_DN2131_c0_g1_i2.p1  ORF type:complete len:334 (-),score=48.48 TRINITY_DN2131_c0_g1_i2:681-1682(-)
MKPSTVSKGLLFVLCYCSIVQCSETVDDLLKKGDDEFILGKHDKALEYYNKAISIDNYNHRALYKRANLYLATNKYRQSLQDFNEVLTIDPDYHLALTGRAKVYQSIGHYQNAKNDLNKAIKLNPKGAGKLEQLITTLNEIENIIIPQINSFYLNNQLSEAKELLKKVILISPGYTNIRILSTKVALSLDEYDTAIEDTKQILKNEKNNLDAIYLRGNAFRNMGLADAAKDHYKQCLSWDPNHELCKTTKTEFENFLSNLSSADENEKNNRPLISLNIINSSFQYLQKENIKFYNKDLYLIKCRSLVKVTSTTTTTPAPAPTTTLLLLLLLLL